MGNCMEGLAYGQRQALARESSTDARARAEAAKVADEFFKSRAAFFEYRRTSVLPFLRELDDAFTLHWAGVNGAKTVTSGLSIASFILFFFPPTIPVAIGLGIGAAVTGGSTAVGDYVADGVKDGHLNEILEKDKEFQEALLQEALKVQSLTQHMTEQKAVEFWGLVAAGSALQSCWTTGTGIADLVAIARISQLASAAGDGAAGAGAAGAGLAGIRLAATTSTKVLGGIGMGVAVLDCAYSWCTGKAGQERLRQAMQTIEKELMEFDQHQAQAAVTVDGPQA